MNQWMKVKTAGLPRWAWISIIGGALAIGLYLRSQDTEETPSEEEAEIEPDESSLSYYEGTEQAGGLAAAGLIGPAQGQVVPVESPYIPEGFVDVFGAQSENLGTLIGALAEREPGERVEVETIREKEPADPHESSAGLTGGGPTKKKPSHKPPKKKQGPKPHKPVKQKKPPRKKGGGGGNKTPRQRQRMGVGKGHKAHR